jgi:23S rRNA (cytosine1962-C5)-methyltransferase
MRDFQPVIDRCVARYHDGTDAARLFHGRGHSFAGYEDITVDLFPPYLIIGSFGDDEHGVQRLAGLLADRLPSLRGVCVQLRDGRRTRTVVASGSVPDRAVVTEGDLRFVVRPKRNQNIGLFLDMAPAREWLRRRSAGLAVLNLFAYTCGFSVAAVAGGARLVVNNDMSRTALDWGGENHKENAHDPRTVSMLPHNLFKSWWKVRRLGPYDVVVIDPPTNQRGSFNAEKQYGQIFKRIPEFTTSGGHILACLNSPFLNTDFLPAQMARWCPRCAFVEYLAASEDFPDQFADRALKVAVFRYSG